MAEAQEVHLPESFITNSFPTTPTQVPTSTQAPTQTQPTIPFRERVQHVLNTYGTDEATLKRELRRLLVPKRGEKTPKPTQNTPSQSTW